MKTYIPLALASLATVMAASPAKADYPVAVHGSVQADIVFPEIDEEIGAIGPYEQKILFNTYADVNMASKFVDAGLRAEFMKWPLPGYEKDFMRLGTLELLCKRKVQRFRADRW